MFQGSTSLFVLNKHLNVKRTMRFLKTQFQITNHTIPITRTPYCYIHDTALNNAYYTTQRNAQLHMIMYIVICQCAMLINS